MTRSGDRACDACGAPLLDDEPGCWRYGHHPGAAAERSPRPLGVTALAVLDGVVGLCAVVAAGWALLPAGHAWLALFAAAYGAFRWAGAAALWRVRREGISLQRAFSAVELLLLPASATFAVLALAATLLFVLAIRGAACGSARFRSGASGSSSGASRPAAGRSRRTSAPGSTPCSRPGWRRWTELNPWRRHRGRRGSSWSPRCGARNLIRRV